MKRFKRIIFVLFVINIAVYISIMILRKEEIEYSGTFVKGVVENRRLY